MGREIRFRCWHRNGKKLEGRRWAFEPAMIYDDKPGDCLLWKNQGQDIEAIMQFTGLRDRRGQEIWEGDVVREGNRTYIIIFSHGAFAMQFIEDGTAYRTLYNIYQHDVEVIGNIYEHPELLEGK